MKQSSFNALFRQKSFFLAIVILFIFVFFFWQSTTGYFLWPFTSDYFDLSSASERSSRSPEPDTSDTESQPPSLPSTGPAEWPRVWPPNGDCTNGVSSRVGSRTNVCTEAFNDACTSAKAQAIFNLNAACVQWCTAQGKTGGTVTCYCPISGNNPDTGNPYTCFVRDPNGGCTATTVAICTCTCADRAPVRRD